MSFLSRFRRQRWAAARTGRSKRIRGFWKFPTEPHERDPVCRSARQNHCAELLATLSRLREVRLFMEAPSVRSALPLSREDRVLPREAL